MVPFLGVSDSPDAKIYMLGAMGRKRVKRRSGRRYYSMVDDELMVLISLMIDPACKLLTARQLFFSDLSLQPLDARLHRHKYRIVDCAEMSERSKGYDFIMEDGMGSRDT